MENKFKRVPDDVPPDQRYLANKRLTLNLLIQGAAGHVHQSAQHLVRPQIEEIHGDLIGLYDRAIAGATYAYWRGFLGLLMGHPNRFWCALHKPNHPFFYHRFLRKHGPGLAERAFESAQARCREKGVPTRLYKHEFVILREIRRIMELEQNHRHRLETIAKDTCHEIIGTPHNLMNGSITLSPAWGIVRTPQTRRGRVLLKAMVGWGGVDLINGQLKVVAKAIVWPLLVHELIKGSMELICLHGLNGLSDGDYGVVLDQTEHLEYEVPMLQIGPEFYQCFLRVIPQGLKLADCVMAVATLEPVALEEFMFDMVETPEVARETLLSLVASVEE